MSSFGGRGHGDGYSTFCMDADPGGCCPKTMTIANKMIGPSLDCDQAEYEIKVECRDKEGHLIVKHDAGAEIWTDRLSYNNSIRFDLHNCREGE